MAYKVNISKKAQSDILKIMDYLLENWSLKDVSVFQNKLDKLLLQLNKMPEIFISHDKKDNTFKVPLTKHNLLFYKIYKSKNIVEVLTVFNVLQNPDKLKL